MKMHKIEWGHLLKVMWWWDYYPVKEAVSYLQLFSYQLLQKILPTLTVSVF